MHSKLLNLTEGEKYRGGFCPVKVPTRISPPPPLPYPVGVSSFALLRKPCHFDQVLFDQGEVRTSQVRTDRVDFPIMIQIKTCRLAQSQSSPTLSKPNPRISSRGLCAGSAGTARARATYKFQTFNILFKFIIFSESWQHRLAST